MTPGLTRAAGKLGMFLLLTLYALWARADLSSASVAYQKRDYAGAFTEYRELAELGQPVAQYNLAVMFGKGQGTEVSNTSAHAAQADQPDAQVTLAEHLLRDHPTRESVAGALVWLERAAKQNNPSAKLYLAALLSTSPDAAIHNPGRALTLADAVKKDFEGDPSLLEIRAAASAAHGNYADARNDQTLAIKRATALGWDVIPMQQRRDRYAANQSWTGDLLMF